MQGKQHYQAKLFTNGDLERYVPKNHRLRRIDKVLDLSHIRELTKPNYSKTQGRPSIDPEVFFRMLIISYLYGMDSDRQLCEDIQVNLAFRWFLKLSLEDDVPDHSSLTRIRDRLGEEIFKKVFEGLVEQCQRAGYVVGRRMMADATLVEANASISSMREKEKPDEVHQKKGYHSYLKQFSRYEGGKKGPRYSNQTHESKTDPDSALVGRTGCFKKLFYKAHYVMDAKERIITDCHVTNGASQENEVLTDRIETQVERFGFPIKEVTADKGYSRGKNLEYFKSKKIRTYIPVGRTGGTKGYSKDEFTYDRNNDQYICPRGEILQRHGRNKKKETVVYKIKNEACVECPLKEECIPNGRIRSINRSKYDDQKAHIKLRMKTAHFKSKLHERIWKIEGLFGEAKNFHGLSRARYRRKSKVQIQVYMTAFVQNLKRLISKPIEGLDRIMGHILDKIWFRSAFMQHKIIFTQN